MLLKLLAPEMSYQANNLVATDVFDIDGADGTILVNRSVAVQVTHRGAWSASPGTPYAINNMVSDGGFWYLAKVNGSTNPTSNTTDWLRVRYFQSDPVLVRFTASHTINGVTYVLNDVANFSTPDWDAINTAGHGVELTYEGTWNASRDYVLNGAVFYSQGNAYYVATSNPSIGDTPGVSGNWTLVNWRATNVVGSFVTPATATAGGGSSNPLYLPYVYLQEDGSSNYRKLSMKLVDGIQTLEVSSTATPAP